MAHAFLWEYSYKGLKLVQLLGQLGGFLAKGRRSESRADPQGSARRTRQLADLAGRERPLPGKYCGQFCAGGAEAEKRLVREPRTPRAAGLRERSAHNNQTVQSYGRQS